MTKPIDDEMIEEFISCTPNYEITIKVVFQEGICLGRHKVGDEWVMKGRGDYWQSPAGICMFAFSSIYPSLQMLMYGGSFPWEPDSDAVLVPCSDSRNPVAFELRRTGVV
jgi:uncharacterized repeat protein (TIGR04076 family)